MNNNQLKAILWQYIEEEFDFDETTIKENEKIFNEEFEDNQVRIAESTFGNITTFDGTTIFIPDSLKIIKSILRYDTCKSFVEIIHFKDVNEVKNYFKRASFDDHLSPLIDETQLIELTN